MKREKNLYIYIDNSNFLNILKNISGKKEKGGKIIDYGKMCSYIKERINTTVYPDYELTIKKVYIYDGLATNNDEKKKKKLGFIRAIGSRIAQHIKIPEENIIDRLVNIELGKDKELKGDDIYLAVDVLVDVFKDESCIPVIVSGDGDFFPLIKRIKEDLDKKIFISFFENYGLSKRLLSILDDGTFIALNIDQITMREKDEVDEQREERNQLIDNF
jgi:uncharacterized LabA/DUF88 family protein